MEQLGRQIIRFEQLFAIMRNMTGRGFQEVFWQHRKPGLVLEDFLATHM